MADVKELTTENFDSVITSADNTPVLVDFWAPWCGPCISMGPIVEEFASEHSDKITVGKLNVDENPQIAEKYKVMSIPTFGIFINGKIEKTVVGSMDKKRLIENFQQWLV